MRRVGILGGSFNPPTKSHIQIADFVLDRGLVDHIWVMPLFSHMYNKLVETPEHRLRMCELAIKGNEHKITVSDYEILNQLRGTYSVVQKLFAEFGKDYIFSLIIGTDNVNISNWFRGDELER